MNSKAIYRSQLSMVRLGLPPMMFVLVLLLFSDADEMGPTVIAADNCESVSTHFQGYCLMKSNCKSVCLTEGFTDGYCKGLIHRKCQCSKDCGNTPGTVPTTPYYNPPNYYN